MRYEAEAIAPPPDDETVEERVPGAVGEAGASRRADRFVPLPRRGSGFATL